MKKWKIHPALFGASAGTIDLSAFEAVAEIMPAVFGVTASPDPQHDLHEEMDYDEMVAVVAAKKALPAYVGYSGLAYIDGEVMLSTGPWAANKVVQAYRACVEGAPDLEWGIYFDPITNLFITAEGAGLTALQAANDALDYITRLVKVKMPDCYTVNTTEADAALAAKFNAEECFRCVRDITTKRTVPFIWAFRNPGPVALSAALFMATINRLYALGFREFILWGQIDDAGEAAAYQAVLDAWAPDFVAEYGDEDLTPVVRGAVATEIVGPAASTDVWTAAGWASTAADVSDGDRGDITVAAGVWTIDNDAVTYAKMQNVSAASRLLGRGSAAGAGDPQEMTVGSGLSISGTVLDAVVPGATTQLIYNNAGAFGAVSVLTYTSGYLNLRSDTGLKFYNGDNANFGTLNAPIAGFTAERNFFFPDGGGTLACMGGADTAVLFNNGGVIGGSISMFWDDGASALTITGQLRLANTGLRIKDTNDSHYLIVAPGSNITANRTFTLTTGDADVTLDITGGNLKLNTAGQGLYIKEGSDATMGVATLVGGTVTVNTTKVTANSRIFLTVQSLGTVGAPKAIAVTARTASTSFTITSEDGTDTSVVAWFIVEPA